MAEKFKAIVFGSSGLVGKNLVRCLEADPDCESIELYCRKPSGSLESSKVKERIIDFENLAAELSEMTGEQVFCCLGTTQKKAGSKENFEKVDFEYVRKIARLSHMRGIKGFHLISSVGASEDSPSFYLRTKARAENALLEIPFFKLRIYRPSLLIGNREERRPLESWAGLLAKKVEAILVGPLQFLKPTDAAQLAQVMLAEAKSDEWNRKILEAPAIRSYF